MVAFMLWSHRERIRKVTIRPFLPAAALLSVSAIIHVYATGRDIEAIMSYSLMMIVWSGVWLILGTAFVKSEWFSLLFLALMIPLPGPVLNDMTHGLQQVSTAGSSALLNHIGFENWRTGYQIQMSNYSLFVDVPCSGFKTLLALLTFDAFFAFMLDGSVKKRLLLFAATAPLAIAINVTRITGIAIVGECISDSAAHVFHDYSGIITVLLGFAVLFTTARLFGCRKFAGLTLF
jgi:exosortase